MAERAFQNNLTASRYLLTINVMNTAEVALICPELMAEVAKAAEHASKGIRDPEERKCARAEMDRIREGIRARHGILDIGVPAIRELRDS